MWTQLNNLPHFVWYPFILQAEVVLDGSDDQGLAIAACSILPDVRIPAPKQGEMFV